MHTCLSSVGQGNGYQEQELVAYALDTTEKGENLRDCRGAKSTPSTGGDKKLLNKFVSVKGKSV